MTQENKVTFGLENVHIAPIKTLAADGVITYGDVFRFPGAIELILDTKGETTPIKADNKDYHFMNSNEGYEGKLKIPHIIDEFATKILGEIKDPQTGVMTEKADASLTEFAMMFQFEGDKNKTRYV
ncbi:phage tail protein, partial [Streptococcus pneumoniae]|nr:phage tail protein [Streptococcus pneumoniae]